MILAMAQRGFGEVPPGTLPSVNGGKLISTGIQGIDDALGGNVALGSMLIVVDKGCSGACSVLTSHFVAEGVAHGHHCLWRAASVPPEGLETQLPRVRDPRGQRKGAERSQEIGEEGDELRIAWQYRRHLRQSMPLDDRAEPTAPGTRRTKRLCHKLEHSATMQREILESSPPKLLGPEAPLGSLPGMCAEHGEEAYGNGKVARWAIEVDPMSVFECGEDERSIVESVAELRRVAWEKGAALLVVVPAPCLSIGSVLRLAHKSEGVLEFEGIGDATQAESMLPNPKQAIALVRTRRVSPIAMAASPPDLLGQAVVMEIHRRQCTVVPLQQQPEGPSGTDDGIDF